MKTTIMFFIESIIILEDSKEINGIIIDSIVTLVI